MWVKSGRLLSARAARSASLQMSYLLVTLVGTRVELTSLSVGHVQLVVASCRGEAVLHVEIETALSLYVCLSSSSLCGHCSWDCLLLQALTRLSVHSPLPRSRGPLQVALAAASDRFGVPLEVAKHVCFECAAAVPP
jgi:hypothetical protein